MKSVGGFLRTVVQRKDSGSLVGKVLKVGMYTVKVEAHLGDGGFAVIYRARDVASSAAYALKHVRMAGEPEALADCHMEVGVCCAAHAPCSDAAPAGVGGQGQPLLAAGPVQQPERFTARAPRKHVHAPACP